MTDLGIYFHKNLVNKADVYYKTSIDESRLSLLSNDSNTLLYGDDFYLIALAIGADLGLMADIVFKDCKLISTSKSEPSNVTNLGRYISKFLNTKQDLANSVGILPSRFSKLINDPNKRAYAFEIFLIAKSTGKDVKSLFELLYGHLELNSPSKQELLRKLKSKK